MVLSVRGFRAPTGLTDERSDPITDEIGGAAGADDSSGGRTPGSWGKAGTHCIAGNTPWRSPGFQWGVP